MTRPEILAPCGSAEALTAAVRSGADAVYFGAGDFNARRNADNFDGEAFSRAAEICRLHGVRFHVTLNTLAADNQLAALQQTVQRTCREAADALILQDLGALRLVRQMCPDMEKHASTQMSVGTRAGLSLLRSRGFTRAVLPRELSASEIEALCKDKPLELEMFVHGALCMCVSGQCLLSAMLGSRSGNRGLCAQPCRLSFAAEGGTGHDLSLKDLSLLENAQTLAALQIDSFKIEGRMKRPEYVAAAVTACKSALDGTYTAQQKAELGALFSRSGFTDGYFQNTLGKEMFGTRQKANVTAATNALFKKYAALYEKERTVFPVDFTLQAKVGEVPTLKAACGKYRAVAVGECLCETAKSVPLTEEKACVQLQKCGGTVFYAQDIHCRFSDNVSLPLSALNALRRTVLSELETQICAAEPKRTANIPLDFSAHTAGIPKRYLRFRSVSQIPDGVTADRIFLPLGTPRAVLESYHAGVYLPRGLFGTEEKIAEQLRNSGAVYALCDTLDAVAIAKNAGVEIIGGAFLNIFNTLALEELAEIGAAEATLSEELTVSQIAALGGSLPRGVCVYGRTPLMLTRNCPVKNGKSCKECGRQSGLTDRKGIFFPVLCENGFSEIFNSRPTYLGDRLSEIRNVDFHLYDFTTESKTECAAVLRAYAVGETPVGEYTRGLFYRGVE